MTIKTGLAAIIAVFSVVLFVAPTTHAEAKPTDKKDQKQPVIVTVQAGDTLSSIADANNTTYVRLFDANDFIANPDIIDVGQQVRVPDANEQLPDRMPEQQTAVAVTQPVTQSTTRHQTAAAPKTYASSAGNTYYYGYCTWYAKERRPDLPNMLGNGGQWVANAAARGYATGTTPRAGAIAEMAGHVAYVESVNGDGTLVISEMNGPAGFGVVGTRTVPASQYRGYIY